MGYTCRRKRRIRFPINLFCEGLQEKLYFRRIKELVYQQSSENIKQDIDLNDNYNTGGGGPVSIAKQACQLSKQLKGYVVFDHDNKDELFEEAVDICKKNRFLLGYSNLNFDYWLILHKIDRTKISFNSINNTNGYVNKLKEVYNIKSFENVKNEKVIRTILSSISLNDVKRAINNAYYIQEKNKVSYGYKTKYTPKSNVYYENPDFSIHIVIEHILKNVLNNYDSI